jgi:hypothetical protein
MDAACSPELHQLCSRYEIAVIAVLSSWLLLLLWGALALFTVCGGQMPPFLFLYRFLIKMRQTLNWARLPSIRLAQIHIRLLLKLNVLATPLNSCPKRLAL